MHSVQQYTIQTQISLSKIKERERERSLYLSVGLCAYPVVLCPVPP